MESQAQAGGCIIRPRFLDRIKDFYATERPASLHHCPILTSRSPAIHRGNLVTWEEVRDCGHPDDLTFTAEDVLDRIARLGDLFAAAP